jgi:hypothetical protein
MRRSFHTAILSLGLALGANGLATAQTDSDRNATNSTVTNAPARTTTADNRDDRGFNLGWLGLIGLAGLIPLFTRRDNHQRHDNHTRTTTSGRGAHA